MTPQRRLDQIEPILADVLRKVDRLIEGQGQLVELATATSTELQNARQDVQQIKTTGEITAGGLAKLTVTVNDLRQEMREGFQRNEETQQEILALLRQRPH